MEAPDLSLTVNALIPNGSTKPDFYYTYYNPPGRPKSSWNYKKSVAQNDNSRSKSAHPNTTKGPQTSLDLSQISPRESRISMALDQVMQINVKKDPSLRTIDLPEEGEKLVTTPRDALHPFSHRQIMFNPKVKSKEYMRAADPYHSQDYYHKDRTIGTPPPQRLQPFQEQNQQTPRQVRPISTHKMPEWGKNSSGRNMAGNQKHYMLYLRSLRHRHDHDRQNHSQSVDSSLQRIQSSKHSSRVDQSSAKALSNGAKRPPQMCTLTETWDVKHARNGTSKSPMDIAERKSEFHRELLYTKQRKQQMNIRTSETPRDDEGILDWLLRSVTAVPLDSKYAPRNTTRLFQLSVHALEKQISSPSTVTKPDRSKSAIFPRNPTENQSRRLYIDPKVRAKTADLRNRGVSINVLRTPASGITRGRNVKSAVSSAAGRLSLHGDESTEEKVESSRRLWSAHHRQNYDKRTSVPTATDLDLDFGQEVIQQYIPNENNDDEEEYVNDETLAGLTLQESFPQMESNLATA
ncbi:uncharacterized protein LOC134851396 isoform X2 [Symsagittifera roscoffensis]|uniref:uncharacterized protein LOC134851396 isoform X2 n=1 Tax=Symsagittifera roscoffensis TaxID=84072 RepID=UPI00307C3604